MNNPTLTAFFVETLQMGNVSYEDLTDELAYMKKTTQMSTENIHDIYFRLQNMVALLSAAELDAIQ